MSRSLWRGEEDRDAIWHGQLTYERGLRSACEPAGRGRIGLREASVSMASEAYGAAVFAVT